MPDWEVELTLTTGSHQAVTKSVIIQDAQREVAKLLGVEECLKWAEEDNSDVPLAALQYFRDARRNGNVMVYELLSELETRWQLSFNIKEATVPLTTATVAEAPSKDNSPRQANGASTLPKQRPLDFRQMLSQQLEYLQSRQKELAGERKRIDAEWAENAGSIADIRNFLMLAATRKPRHKKEKAADAAGRDQG